MGNSQNFLRIYLGVLVAGHWIVIVGNLSAFFILPFATSWYVALPIMSYIGLLTFSRVLDCPLTRLENKIRKQLGMPEIKGFISHYLIKPYVRNRRKRRKAIEEAPFTTPGSVTKQILELQDVESKRKNINIVCREDKKELTD